MPVSEDMVADLYASPSKPGAVLVTIEAEGLDDPVRVTSWPRGLLSNGEDYAFAPFDLTWSGAGSDEPAREAKLTIAFSTEVLEMVRLAQGRPTATVERVRVAAPDVAERAINGGFVAEAQVGQESISITLKHRDYASEPACCASYVKARTPALF